MKKSNPIKINFSTHAINDLKSLDKPLRKRISQKIEWFIQQPSPLLFAEPLKHYPPATHRFRIGDYRATFEYLPNDNTILILAVKHRRQAYN